MKIAVSYDTQTNQVFDHFGHAPAFKMCTVENDSVVSSDVVIPDGMGHSVMVSLMKEHGVDVVLCGWIGGHALDGLKENGIEAYTGAEGDVDAAVQAYLQGNLSEAEGGECGCDHDHGHEEDHCCGHCHQPQYLFEGKNVGKTCSVHYKGTFNDGTQFDSSYDRGEPLTFTCGIGQMIRGFDQAVADMEVGEEKDIHLMPEEAYGQKDPNAVFTVAIKELPGSEDLIVGQRLYLQNQFGQPFPVSVTEKDDENITFDANHEMAGKELNFHVELVSAE